MIILCRIGETQAIANLIKSLVIAVYQEGGVIRKVSNLGDRISDKSYKAKDGSNNSLIRYLSVHFDANPESKILAEKVARGNSECVQVFTHKMKEIEYYKEMLNKDAWAQDELDPAKFEYKDELIKVAAKSKVELGEQYEDKLESLKNKLI